MARKRNPTAKGEALIATATAPPPPPSDPAASLLKSGFRRTEWQSVKDLSANPANYRRHPAAQKQECRESIAECGFSKPLIRNLTTGNLIDGHLRLEIAIEDGVPELPVNLGEWTVEQEETLLAVLDGITGHAEMDPERFRDLHKRLSIATPALRAMLDSEATRALEIQLREAAAAAPASPDPAKDPEKPPEPPASLAQQGFRAFSLMLGPDHYDPVIDAVNHAKKLYAVDNSAAAVYLMAKDWMERHGSGEHDAASA